MRCGRSLCQADAVAVAEVDVPAAQVRLVAYGDRYDGLLLCAKHADRLNAPVGWEFTDERRVRHDELIDLRSEPMVEPDSTMLARAFRAGL